MIICSNCKEEMVCSRTGVLVLWNVSHGRKGDEFKCPKCENTTTVLNGSSYSVSPLEAAGCEARDRLIEMT